jgi:hypothetical protein
MANEELAIPMDAESWDAIVSRVQATRDFLEDGAIARVSTDSQSQENEIHVYATELNKPRDWNYPFLEEIPHCTRHGALVGIVRFTGSSADAEVIIPAAAASLRADYESGANDMDYTEYERAVADAVRGDEADRTWLKREVARLVPRE